MRRILTCVTLPLGQIHGLMSPMPGGTYEKNKHLLFVGWDRTVVRSPRLAAILARQVVSLT
jgi:butyrate kinase